MGELQFVRSDILVRVQQEQEIAVKEPGFQKVLLRSLRTFTTFGRHIAPFASWLYVAFAVYLLVGATLFPGWWKRFVYSSGFRDYRFYVAAWQYLLGMVKERLPLGLVLAALTVCVPAYLLFAAGRRNLSRIHQPIRSAPRWLLLAATVVLALTLVGLAAVKAEYQTPDELHAMFEQAETKLREDDDFTAALRPSPPSSGYFIYLDPPKLARAYNTLQKELTVVLQTETREDSDDAKVTVNLKNISGEAVSRERVERSIQLAPTIATPERQAQWLIDTYNHLSLVIDLPLFFGGDDYRSYELRQALESLQKRKVVLTHEQVAAAVDGDAALLEHKLNKPNVPLLFEGDIVIEGGQEHFKLTFQTGGGARVIAQGVGSMSTLDDGLHACTRQAGGCQFSGKILAIVWRSNRNRSTIKLDVIPLALW